MDPGCFLGFCCWYDGVCLCFRKRKIFGVRLSSLGVLVYSSSVLTEGRVGSVVGSVNSPAVVRTTGKRLTVSVCGRRGPGLAFVSVMVPMGSKGTTVSRVVRCSDDTAVFITSSINARSRLGGTLTTKTYSFVRGPVSGSRIVDLVGGRVKKGWCMCSVF